ncbi:MAG TPA: aspartate 1-decarboxylase [Elusimicrobia bacterium]|nr:MAG: aspartate 1-decarboxylase [Elusimicrobia bacterium GWD2_63_28]HCC48993.1 aspartate 1-decarboxylase [Elusimicrobiota bacterium]
MIRTLMKSKIHRVAATQTDVNYNGSITIDRDLARQADLLENEKVDIYNVNSGARFSTYVIHGDRGVIGVNGAAARLVQKGDLLIIVSYAQYSEEECAGHVPTVVCVQKSAPGQTGHVETLLAGVR